MGKKKAVSSVTVSSNEPEKFEIWNLKESVFPVPVYNAEGKIDHIYLRLQGRNGQTPPVIEAYMITDALRNLEKKRFLKLVKV